MSTTQIYLDLPDELQQLLSENQISIADILHQQGIEAEVKLGTMPGQTEEGARDKDVATIILASAAAVIAIGWAISSVLRTLKHGPYLVEGEEVTELRDANGKILLDAKGNAQLKRTKKFELLESRKENTNQGATVEYQPGAKIVLKVRSATKQM